VKFDPKNPEFSHAKRWCPWLAAYSGARISELTALEREDIWQEGAVWVMHFDETKTGEPRTVPIHQHLIEQGFIEFVIGSGKGPLFYVPAHHRKDAELSPAGVRAQAVAEWVRRVTNLDRNVDPNHGWRHTWKNHALAAGIDVRLRDAIAGHGKQSVARDYEEPTVPMKAEALARFPRYQIDPVRA